MIYISSNNSSTFLSIDNENKCWFHTIDFSLRLIKQIDETNLIGFKKNINTKKFLPGNEIFLVTRMNDKFVCYGHSIIEKKKKSTSQLYGFYDNKYELEIKRIKYFLQPIIIDDIRDQLKSIKSNGRISDVLRIGYYKEISSEDYNLILKQSPTTGMFPVYLEEYSKNMKEFILDSCKSLYNILKSQGNYKQIEINEFIYLLNLSLKGFGINKNFEELKRFYSRYAHELGFKHVSSSDFNKFVVLLTPSGEKNNFVYINLE